MAKLPQHYADQPELVAAIVEARQVQMETEDTSFAIEWLMEHHAITLASATKALTDETFRHPALYPEGHPGLEALKAENRARHRRSYNRQKLRPQVIERDDSRCQNCNKRVWGRNAQLDHKDPEGPESLDNLILLCQSCNLVKGRRSWGEFQEAEREWREQVTASQNARPDIVCKQTGLSIKGRTWKESGCTNPSWCLREEACTPNMNRFYDCPCHHYGCYPDCTGCGMCGHDEITEPSDLICDIGEPCESPSRCWKGHACIKHSSPSCI